MDRNTDAALRALHRESVAHALHTWRLADAALRHPFLGDQRAAYERAVGTVLAELRRYDSIPALARYYATDRLAVHAAVFAACFDPTDGPRLLASVVEGAAFWRRVLELVAQAVG
jgi:hypothetical protein